ncbi:AI-2E family transporter [Azorhizobium oxalatiphilum]|uniref:AI-2E family transporter n=1 Tax=Azorhizobium oxalatiphilum TaxID=980631 RepID=A0A917F890_9HYPH|nr:AI-2E family transporter [Azorhizobium oxalatiphilum]GGF59461.1 AI-2E family transporter [Azorhizobium oxalatiphilum]
MKAPNAQQISFFVLISLITAAFIWLLLPFYGAVLWAVILAILFNPLQRWLVRILNGHENLAAALSVLACICIVVIPGSMILASLAQEATSVYQRLSTQEFNAADMAARARDALPGFVRDMLPEFNLDTLRDIQGRLVSILGQTSQIIATQALSIGQGTAQLFVSLGVMLYMLFFLFRDGPSLAGRIRRTSPLSPHHTDSLFTKFSDVVQATVKGNVIIAAVQGAIGGVAFWALGIEGALLWGVLMAMLSLVPAVGAALVWAPAAAYLLFSGQYVKGIILLGIGVFVIGLIDNLLRPPLVGKGTRLPDYVVLVSTLGGLSLFGVNGFVIGPLIAALFVAVWALFADDHGQPALAAARPAEDTDLPGTDA